LHGLLVVGDPVDEHGLVAIEVTGQQDLRSGAAEAEGGDGGVHGPHGPQQFGAQSLDVVGGDGVDVAARDVDEVERLEHGAHRATRRGRRPVWASAHRGK
jgi:hypothetical protein